MAVKSRRNVPARLAMHRPQPFQKSVNVVVVEDAGQRQLGGWMVVCHAGQCRAGNAGDQAKAAGRGVMPKVMLREAIRGSAAQKRADHV